MHPILFKIGPFTAHTYGLVVAIAFLTVFFLMYKEAKKLDFYPAKILDLELIMIIFGIIGARLLHVLVNFSFYKENLFEIFQIWNGGLAFYGGLILSMIASWAFIIKNKMPLWKTADLIAPYLALGQSIGRIGCFLNGCCYGKPQYFPFLGGVMFPGDIVYRYPAQIYASLALLCIFIILRIMQKKAPFTGFVFLFYIILYSVQRFFIDFLRGDTPRFLNLTASQIISIMLFTLAVMIMLFIRKRQDGRA